ncbi:hypothetical protein V5O48_007447 [Marasmius crinis-equi]|uniref:Uncharacterized protein n=1 Tax=Marasmius crinis-equi TaxID=585013 RepID=A0ABR3FGR6_9AGAR
MDHDYPVHTTSIGAVEGDPKSSVYFDSETKVRYRAFEDGFALIRGKDQSCLVLESQTIWKRYSANPTLASIQRAIESRDRDVESDEEHDKGSYMGIPVEHRQTMEERLRESWRELALSDLPTRPSSTNSSDSDDSTPPSTPAEGRSPVMGATRVVSGVPQLPFNPFPDEDDYVDFMIKTASTMTVDAFDPFKEEPEDGVEPVYHLPALFTKTTVSFALPDEYNDQASTFRDLDRLGRRTHPVHTSGETAPASFKDLDRLGCRTPQVELNRRKPRRVRRRQAQAKESESPTTPEIPAKLSQYPQYQASAKPTYASILASPKQAHIRRHSDEQRQLLLLFN